MLAQADGGVVQFCILGISGLLLALERQWRTGREKFPSLQVAVVVFSGLSECVVPLSLLSPGSQVLLGKHWLLWRL